MTRWNVVRHRDHMKEASDRIPIQNLSNNSAVIAEKKIDDL